MNKEVKEAIYIVKGLTEDDLLNYWLGPNIPYTAIQILLNYIDKLEKENEELHKQVDIEFVEENYIEKSKVISKDKIRDKIKELEEKCEATKKTYKGTYALNGNYLEAFSQSIILRELLGE